MEVKSLFAAAAAVCASLAYATSTPAGWTDDFDAAKKQAAAEGKLLLVDFSGSDWCGWCKKLDREVFAKPEFMDGVKNDFVLVMIDSPRDKSLLSEKAAKQNPELQRKYKISGYPTVLIMDADGEVLEKTGYRDGGAEAYAKYLQGVKKYALAIVAMKREIAGMPEGSPARLAKIDAVFASADNDVLRKNESFVEELLKHDGDGKFAGKYPFVKYCLPLEKKFRRTCDDLQRLFFKKLGEVAGKGQKPTSEQRDAVIAEVDAEAVVLLKKVRDEVSAAKASAPASARDEIAKLERRVSSFVSHLEKRRK
ncbi:MAG: thioredoxin family protein [Kiritimatiellae bacterium]|nr:thioredoxin family protein [Kiritimatiellia bacterium]